MVGIIGKKVGMTSMFDEEGKAYPCTVIEAGPCLVTQVKTAEKDGYLALQLSFDEKKLTHTTKAMKGHFAKANVTPKRKLIEFRDFSSDKKLGETINVDIFEKGDYVDVVGYTKGKGFQGVVKRHGFGGVGSGSHGQHDRQRAPGSLGGSSFPSHVLKGMRMAGRTGGKRVKAQNLKVLHVNPEQHLLVVNGAVPGYKGSYIVVQK